MILTKETLSAGPKIGTGEGVAHSKRWVCRSGSYAS